MKDIFNLNREALLELFQEGGKADYYTWFMRLLTAGMYVYTYVSVCIRACVSVRVCGYNEGT